MNRDKSEKILMEKKKQHPAPPLPGASNVAKKAQGLKNGKETTLNNFVIIPCEKIKLSTKYW